MSKVFIFIGLLPILSVHHTYSMINKFQHKPITQDPSYKLIRNVITDWTKNEVPTNTIKHVITIKRTATPEEKEGTCIRYAINTITNSTAPIKMYLDITCNIDIEKFFEQTLHPKKNDLVIYTKNKKSHTFKHFAIVISHSNYESKWGTRSEIIQHDLFSIPTEYGKAASFWTLKPEFHSLEGKEKLPKMIEENVQFLQNELIENRWNKKRHKKVKIGQMLLALLNNNKK